MELDLPIFFIKAIIIYTQIVRDTLLCHMGVVGSAAFNLPSLLLCLCYTLLVLRMTLINGRCVYVLVIVRGQAKASLVLCKLVPDGSGRRLHAAGLQRGINIFWSIRNPSLKCPLALGFPTRDRTVCTKGSIA